VAAADEIVSHWSKLFENFQASPLAFYQAVESALLKREIPDSKNSRIDHKEAGVLSAKREYLRVQREKLLFDIGAAPFGTGFFVSWWLVDEFPRLNPLVKIAAVFGLFLVAIFLVVPAGMVLGSILFLALLFGGLAVANSNASIGNFDDRVVRALPLIGALYNWLFKPDTYYRIDSMKMFQTAVHNAVLEVIDAMTAEKGLRALSESERKPVMREFYQRRSS